MKSVSKTLRTCCLVGLSFVAGAAFADGNWGVQDSFEGDSPVLTHWSGNTNVVSVSTDAEYLTVTAGYPIPGMHGDGQTYALAIEGKAVCTNTSEVTEDSSKTTQVDFMVKVTAPDEAPEIASEDEGAQIALAAWTNEVSTLADTVALKLYCKPRGVDTASWVVLTNAVETGTWVRVTMNFDYTNNTCKVSMNGDALVTANGYRSSTVDSEDGGKGAWYKLANAPDEARRTVSEVKIVGTTFVDDLVITNATMDSYNPYVDESGNEITTSITPASGSGNAVDVPLSMVDESGLSKEEIAAGGKAEGDSLSVLEIAEAGLEVGKGQKFEMQTITPSKPDGTGDSKTQQFSITFPGSYNDGRYTVTVSTDEAGKTELTPTDSGVTYNDSGNNTWTGTVPVGSNKTIYFHLKATQPSK